MNTVHLEGRALDAEFATAIATGLVEDLLTNRMSPEADHALWMLYEAERRVRELRETILAHIKEGFKPPPPWETIR